MTDNVPPDKPTVGGIRRAQRGELLEPGVTYVMPASEARSLFARQDNIAFEDDNGPISKEQALELVARQETAEQEAWEAEGYERDQSGLWTRPRTTPVSETDRVLQVAAKYSGNGQGADGVGSLVREGDIAAALRGDVPPIKLTVGWRDDGEGLYGAGLVADLHGESSLGKTWKLQHVVGELLASGGAALWIDYESSLPRFVERLQALDCDPEILARRDRLRYIQIDGAVRDAEREHLADILAELNPQPGADILVCIDAAGAALARDGRDENSARDVGEWYERTVRPLTHTGAAVAVIDQVTRDPGTRTRGSRGSGQKLYLVDISYSARAIGQPFSKTKAGGFKLVCAKDRTGTYAVGETVATVEITPKDTGISIAIKNPETEQPTILMERIVNYLHGRPGTSMKTIEREVQGKAAGLRWARDCLLDDGAIRTDEHGRFVLTSTP